MLRTGIKQTYHTGHKYATYGQQERSSQGDQQGTLRSRRRSNQRSVVPAIDVNRPALLSLLATI